VARGELEPSGRLRRGGVVASLRTGQPDEAGVQGAVASRGWLARRSGWTDVVAQAGSRQTRSRVRSPKLRVSCDSNIAEPQLGQQVKVRPCDLRSAMSGVSDRRSPYNVCPLNVEQD